MRNIFYFSLTTGKLDLLTDTFVPGPGCSFASLVNKLPTNLIPNYPNGVVPNIPPTAHSIYFLLMNISLYYVLALYFDQVIVTKFGKRRGLFFMFNIDFWIYGNSKISKKSNKVWQEKVLKESFNYVSEEDEDTDIELERIKALDASI